MSWWANDEDVICSLVWEELEKLEDQARQGGVYQDSSAYDSLNEVARLLEVTDKNPSTRHDLLRFLADDKSLADLLQIFVGCGENPALQYACLEILMRVIELPVAHEVIMSRLDVLAELLSVLSSPRPRRVSPAHWSCTVTPAVGALATISRLMTSCGGLTTIHADTWVSLGALRATAMAMIRHRAFVEGDELIPPALFFIASALLRQAGAGKAPEGDELFLAHGSLTLLVERRGWVAYSDAKAISIPDVLVALFRPGGELSGVVSSIPLALRAASIAAARWCEREGIWSVGSTAELVHALGEDQGVWVTGRETKTPATKLTSDLKEGGEEVGRERYWTQDTAKEKVGVLKKVEEEKEEEVVDEQEEKQALEVLSSIISTSFTGDGAGELEKKGMLHKKKGIGQETGKDKVEEVIMAPASNPATPRSFRKIVDGGDTNDVMHTPSTQQSSSEGLQTAEKESSTGAFFSMTPSPRHSPVHSSSPTAVRKGAGQSKSDQGEGKGKIAEALPSDMSSCSNPACASSQGHVCVSCRVKSYAQLIGEG